MKILLIQSVLYHTRPQQGIFGCGNTNTHRCYSSGSCSDYYPNTEGDGPIRRVFSLNTPALVESPQVARGSLSTTEAARQPLHAGLLPLRSCGCDVLDAFPAPASRQQAACPSHLCIASQKPCCPFASQPPRDAFSLPSTLPTVAQERFEWALVTEA